MVTMRGHPGENNVITCYPDTYTPVSAENGGANKAFSRMRVHIFNLRAGV